jgi:hypothetical protein
MTAMKPDEITSLGASLQQVTKGVKPGRVWYFGKDEPYFDVFFDVEDNQVTWFQFTLRGKSLTWNGRSVNTGTTNELSADTSYYSASKTIHDDRQLDIPFLHLVTQVLQSRPDQTILINMATILENYRSGLG